MNISQNDLLFFIIVNVVFGFIIALTWNAFRQSKIEILKRDVFKFLLVLVMIMIASWMAVRKIDEGYKGENTVLINRIDSLNRLQYKFDSLRSENVLLIEKVSKYDNTLSMLEHEDTACYTEFIRRYVLFE